MPRLVDHEERRRRIGDVVLRLVAEEGLRAATFRRVAADCGWSPGAVQYYFASSAEMLDAAFAQIGERREARVHRQLADLGRPPGERDILEAALRTGLPLDEERRVECLAEAAWLVRAGAGAGSNPREGLPQLIELFRSLLESAQAAGLLVEGVDPAREAQVLWSLVAVQARTVTLGAGSPEEILAVLDYHLGRVFREPRADAG